MAAPTYVMTAQSLDKQSGIELMEAALIKMAEVIKAKGGDLVIKSKVRLAVRSTASRPGLTHCSRTYACAHAQPRAVSEADDKELQDLMAKAEQETAQGAGDEPEDDEL